MKYANKNNIVSNVQNLRNNNNKQNNKRSCDDSSICIVSGKESFI